MLTKNEFQWTHEGGTQKDFQKLQDDVNKKRQAYFNSLDKNIKEKYSIIEEYAGKINDLNIPYVLFVNPDYENNPDRFIQYNRILLNGEKPEGDSLSLRFEHLFHTLLWFASSILSYDIVIGVEGKIFTLYRKGKSFDVSQK